ncbi:hypothetical protein BDK51DRAFT_45951 [Blyttiomyces helicus]|uniref:Uncharacterized protein n=1 Tax=Blyttiomyces helicus TaxID=388810 RepID=A0A4V1ISL4_9FUNG|nr:hypothetical protein BDK51DRAFT_45951 [Blyttiomyces helicus]|eukprot:RKO93967.1 hypothetical protein BDK51DRAFT_45951 [Blyttiomyces helicus]
MAADRNRELQLGSLRTPFAMRTDANCPGGSALYAAQDHWKDPEDENLSTAIYRCQEEGTCESTRWAAHQKDATQQHPAPTDSAACKSIVHMQGMEKGRVFAVYARTGHIHGETCGECFCLWTFDSQAALGLPYTRCLAKSPLFSTPCDGTGIGVEPILLDLLKALLLVWLYYPTRRKGNLTMAFPDDLILYYQLASTIDSAYPSLATRFTNLTTFLVLRMFGRDDSGAAFRIRAKLLVPLLDPVVLLVLLMGAVAAVKVTEMVHGRGLLARGLQPHADVQAPRQVVCAAVAGLRIARFAYGPLVYSCESLPLTLSPFLVVAQFLESIALVEI